MSTYINADFEEIENILWDGTEEQLYRLMGKPIAYSYSQEYGAFSIYGEKEISRSHGASYTPKCVELFGDEYVFGPGSLKDKLAEEYEQFKRSKKANESLGI